MPYNQTVGASLILITQLIFLPWLLSTTLQISPDRLTVKHKRAFIHCLLMIAKLSLYFLQIFYWSNKDPRYPFITILNQCLDVLLIIEMIHLFSSHILVITLFHAAIRSAATIKSRTRPCLQCIIILYHCLHNKKSFEVLQQLSVDSEQRGPVCYVLTYHSSTTLADFRVWGLGTCATSPSPPRE